MKPNIVFFVSDQFRKAAMGFWNQPEYRPFLNGEADPVHTPHLDRLAGESRVLAHAVSSFPLCSPYRGMMLSGLFPEKNGVVLNCNSSRPVSQLRTDISCISDILKNSGYSSGYIGKLHTDHPTANLPISGGYAESPRGDGNVWDAYTPPGPKRHSFDFWYSYGAFDNHRNPHYWDSNGDFHQPGKWSADHETDIACAYIRNDAGQRRDESPFALWLSTNPPHNPYDSEEDCQKEDLEWYRNLLPEELRVRSNASPDSPRVRENLKYYFASVTGVDRCIGRVLNELEKSGLMENTIFIFTADHGDSMGSHGLGAKNHPFNESVEVPFILRYPDQIAPGVDETMLSPVDIMPTLLGLCGLEDSIPDNLDGRDLSGYLKAGSTGSESSDLSIETPDSPEGVLLFRNVNAPESSDGLVRDYVCDYLGVKTRRYTLCLGGKADQPFTLPCLFDNQSDPYQMENLYYREPQTVRELTVLLKSLIPGGFPLGRLHPAVIDCLGTPV